MHVTILVLPLHRADHSLPKISFNETKIVEITAFIDTVLFNDRYKSLLDILDILNVKIEPRVYEICLIEDSVRVT